MSKPGAPAFGPDNFLLPLLFLGFTEILTPQPWGKDDIRQKGEGAADAAVPEMEAGPSAVSGGRLRTGGGGFSGTELRH